MTAKSSGVLAILMALASIAALARTADACTGIRLKAEDGSVVCARTMEFALDLQPSLLIVPRNRQFVGTAPGEKPGLRWQSKYGSTGTNGLNMPVLSDGLNEKGLGVGTFYFPGYTQYQDVSPDEADKSLGSWELPQLLLSTCTSVPEAIAAARAVRVSSVQLKDIDFSPTFHFVVHDAEGRCAVLEYVGGELKVYDNPIGAITNAPTFDWQITNLCNYINLSVNGVPPVELSGIKLSGFGQGSGMLGLPGDFTPPSRFVRAVAFSQSALPVATADECVLQAFHILNQFDIPRGAARSSENGKVMADYTIFTSASDLKNARYYFHTFENRRIREVNLNKVDLDAKNIKVISMGEKESIEDLSSRDN